MYDTLKGKKIINEAAGNNRYIALTSEAVYIGSKGIATGSPFGKQVKRIPLEQITAVDVTKRIVLVDLQIIMAGSNETKGILKSSTLLRAHDENLIAFKKKHYSEVQTLANDILSARETKLSVNNALSKQNDIPNQLKQLADLKNQDVITEEEFLTKKKDLLARM